MFFFQQKCESSLGWKSLLFYECCIFFGTAASALSLTIQVSPWGVDFPSPNLKWPPEVGNLAQCTSSCLPAPQRRPAPGVMFLQMCFAKLRSDRELTEFNAALADTYRHDLQAWRDAEERRRRWVCPPPQPVESAGVGRVAPRGTTQPPPSSQGRDLFCPPLILMCVSERFFLYKVLQIYAFFQVLQNNMKYCKFLLYYNV